METMENNMEVPQNIKNRSTILSSNSTCGYMPKGNEIVISKRYLCSHVHCSFIANVWKQQKCPSTDEWDNWNDQKQKSYYKDL